MKTIVASKKVLLVFSFVHFLELSSSTPAATHLHAARGSEEREQDGAFIGRGHNHIVDGQHHSEFDHEAIIGSVKDAEEFDHLSPEESKRRLRILLTKMDLNKDDQIERKELHSWILRSFRMLSEEESQDRFEDNDENDDGKVTWDEYLSDTFGIRSSEIDNEISAESRLEDDKLIKDDKAMFEYADKDKNGWLDKTEYLLFSHPEEQPEMWPLILKQTLDEKDKNQDGFIDFQEYIGERGRDHDKEWLISEKEVFDNEHDKNHDGRLNSNEILSWVVPSNDEIAEEEVDHLFGASDDDNDDFLSYDEVLEHHDIFVGSEATDYGDHLHNIHVFQDEL